MALKLPKADKQPKAYHHAPKMEKSLAQQIGGARIPQSGAGHIKGDVRLEKILRIEAKGTSNKSFSVTREMVAKIETAALGAGEAPAIVIEFLGPTGKVESRVAVVPFHVISHLCLEA